FELRIDQTGTVANFIRHRNTIAPAGRFTGETTNDGGKIDSRAHRGFIKPAKFLEPAKEGFTCGMRKWSLQSRFADAGSLSNHHHVADDGAAGDGRGNHSRTTSATSEACDVIFQSLPARFHHPRILRNSWQGETLSSPTTKTIGSAGGPPTAKRGKRSDSARC